MILSEAEIHHCIAIEFSREDDPQEHVPGLVQLAIEFAREDDRLWQQRAAHAIAEKLAEGVVWEGTAVFDWDGTMPALYLDDEPSADVLTSGDFFTVTVTKEE